MDELNKIESEISSKIIEYNEKYNKYKEKKLLNNFNGNHEIAKKITNSFDETNDENTKKLFDEISNYNALKHHLLKYELNYLILDPINNATRENIIEKIIFYLNRYQFRAGGYFLEDFNWKIYYPTDTKYNLLESQIIFENSTNEYGAENNETIEFLEKIVKLLNNITPNLNAKYKFKHTHNVVWVIIIVNL